jgi:hypothetical protein
MIDVTHFTTDEFATDALLVRIQLDDEGSWSFGSTRVCVPIYTDDAAEWEALEPGEGMDPLAVIDLSADDARRFAHALLHAAEHAKGEIEDDEAHLAVVQPDE